MRNLVPKKILQAASQHLYYYNLEICDFSLLFYVTDRRHLFLSPSQRSWGRGILNYPSSVRMKMTQQEWENGNFEDGPDTMYLSINRLNLVQSASFKSFLLISYKKSWPFSLPMSTVCLPLFLVLLCVSCLASDSDRDELPFIYYRRGGRVEISGNSKLFRRPLILCLKISQTPLSPLWIFRRPPYLLNNTLFS